MVNQINTKEKNIQVEQVGPKCVESQMLQESPVHPTAHMHAPAASMSLILASHAVPGEHERVSQPSILCWEKMESRCAMCNMG